MQWITFVSYPQYVTGWGRRTLNALEELIGPPESSMTCLAGKDVSLSLWWDKAVKLGLLTPRDKLFLLEALENAF